MKSKQQEDLVGVVVEKLHGTADVGHFRFIHRLHANPSALTGLMLRSFGTETNVQEKVLHVLHEVTAQNVEGSDLEEEESQFDPFDTPSKPAPEHERWEKKIERKSRPLNAEEEQPQQDFWLFEFPFNLRIYGLVITNAKLGS